MYGVLSDSEAILAKFTAPLSVSSEEPTQSGDSLSLKRHVVRMPAQRWKIEAHLEPLSHGANELMALLVTKGNHSPIKISVPQNYGATQANTVTSLIEVSSIHVTGSSSVYGVFQGTLPAGTFIKFNNHKKLYMVTETVSGSGTINLYPGLRSSVPGSSGAPIGVNFEEVIVDFLYEDAQLKGMQYSDGILMSMGSVTFLEDL